MIVREGRLSNVSSMVLLMCVLFSVILTRIKELLCGANAISDRFIAKLAVIHGGSQLLCIFLAVIVPQTASCEW
jgi:hypothetical protein